MTTVRPAKEALSHSDSSLNSDQIEVALANDNCEASKRGPAAQRQFGNYENQKSRGAERASCGL